jgi:hypothetical protein
MNDELMEYFLLVNKALIDGLKVAVFMLEKVEEISPERRQATIDELNALIAQSEKPYKKKSHQSINQTRGRRKEA